MVKKDQKEHSANAERRSAGSRTGVKLVRTLVGHENLVRSLAFDSTGNILASASFDTTVKLWEPATGKMLNTLKGHEGWVRTVAFDPTRSMLASGGADSTIKLWNTDGQLLFTLKKHTGAVLSVAFARQGQTLASSSNDGTIRQWDASDGRLLRTMAGHDGPVQSVAFRPQGDTLASGSHDKTVRLWESGSGKLLHTLKGHTDQVMSVAFDPKGLTLVSGSRDHTLKLWDVAKGKLIRTLEGHTADVVTVAFSPDGLVCASRSADDTVRIWNCQTWEQVTNIKEPKSDEYYAMGLAFHPTLPILATVGSAPRSDQDRCRLIHLWELDIDAFLAQAAEPTVRYVNAKVVLVGDTGVGKTGLSLVLNRKPYRETDSTAGRHVWTFDSREVDVGPNAKQTRETLLWDLAGQPGYRVIHQLHLNEIAVALVVFDARSEIDPMAGVRHWERALRLAQQRQGFGAVPLKKFLVSARTDRGIVSVSKERLDKVLKEFEFDGYFETSAKIGRQIKELRQAIEEAIPWEELPEVSSSTLFADIKAFLLKAKKTGRLIAPDGELYDSFARTHPKIVKREPNLSDQFETCIGRLEIRDLIRRLSFGRYVLLQPELLDAYASAMVNAAKEEPDGLGSIAEEAALAGHFYVPKEQKILDRGQEQLVLHATVEELARYDLALRESADDRRYLVFPSQFNRDYQTAPEPKGKAVAITFDGPVQSLYSTLAVRLSHSGLFTTGRAEMWRNAAIFNATAGGKCGLYLHEFEEARGRLIIFYDEKKGVSPTPETRFHFEEFVLAHAQRHALSGTVEFARFFVCANGHPVPDDYVKLLTEQGKKVFDCPCGMKVSLAEPKELIHFDSQVAVMDRSADQQRAFEMFVESARGETSTPSFMQWAGDDRVTLAIVFTDVVGSTALGQKLGDERMEKLRRSHFGQSRKLINHYKGREIKTIGDSFMAAFKSVSKALDYAMALQQDPGDNQIQLRAGIHIGPMTVAENDVFGGTVSFAARVVKSIRGPEIWLSQKAKKDFDGWGDERHAQLKWHRKDGVEMKGFNGTFSLWSLQE
jgi:WD40 repeat protein/class 3 adenylate cyclase